MGTLRKHDLRTYTNSALAEKRKLPAKEEKKNLDYSSRGSSSTKGSKDAGSEKKGEYKQSVVSMSLITHLIYKMDRGLEMHSVWL